MTRKFCDRCGKEIKNAHMVSVGTRDNAIGNQAFCYGGYEQTVHVELCDSCINELRLQTLFQNINDQGNPKDNVKEQFFAALSELIKAAMDENGK
jgi:hypothetical protein